MNDSAEPASPESSSQPLSEVDEHKAQEIRAACKDRDLLALTELARSRPGLLDDEIRRIAWPILLGSDQRLSEEPPDWTTLPRHRDEDQVQLDVNRSFVYYPTNESEVRLQERKKQLSDVITAVLLLVLGPGSTGLAVARLSLLRIRDFMLPTLSAAETHLHLLPSILKATDPTLYNHLAGATRPTPFFALAATLTLYAHDIEEYGDIARLFDFLLASEAVVPVYLFAVIVMSRKKELLEIEHDEPEMLHSILSKLPKPLDLEHLIARTQDLFQQCPPEKLPDFVWARVSSSSVLKTTRDPHALSMQTLEDGQRLLAKQATEVKRQDMIKRTRQQAQVLLVRYRRPVRWTAAAVLVALFAIYLPATVTQRLTFLSQRILDWIR